MIFYKSSSQIKDSLHLKRKLFTLKVRIMKPGRSRSELTLPMKIMPWWIYNLKQKGFKQASLWCIVGIKFPNASLCCWRYWPELVSSAMDAAPERALMSGWRAETCSFIALKRHAHLLVIDKFICLSLYYIKGLSLLLVMEHNNVIELTLSKVVTPSSEIYHSFTFVRQISVNPIYLHNLISNKICKIVSLIITKS